MADSLSAAVAGRCSILVPAYGVRPWIGAALDSALAQTYGDVEVIVVDDASTDGTADLLAGYGDRIVVATRSVNRGVGAARNAGLRLASGEFVALLDGDDVYLPERVEVLVQALADQPDAGAATSDAWIIDGERWTRELLSDRWPAQAAALDLERSGELEAAGRQLERILLDNFLFAAGVFRRDVLLEVGGWDSDVWGCEDFDLWVRVLLAGHRVLQVAAPLAGYRVRPGQMSSNRAAQRADHDRVLGRHLLAAAERLPSPVVATSAHRVAQHHRRVRDLTSASRFARLGASVAPGPVARAKLAALAAAWGVAGRVSPLASDQR